MSETVIQQPELNLPAVKSELAENEDLNKFLSKIAKSLRKQQALAAWHISLYAASKGKVELPYQHDLEWISANKYNSGYFYKDTTTLVPDEVYKYTDDIEYRSDVNMEKTVEYLSLVVKTAKSVYAGLFVEKKYDEDQFRLVFTIPINAPDGATEKVVIIYSAKREAVCKKKVTGTEHVPQQIIEAHEKELYEWECEPVSLLGFKHEAIETS